MAVKDADLAMDDFLADMPKSLSPSDCSPIETSPKRIPGMTNGKVKLPATPMKKITDKPLPKDPPITPRIKKKVPWKGKNIMILIPRDEDRGRPGQAQIPLGQEAVDKMFASWRDMGYNTDGFDLLVEDYPSVESGESHSRVPWPSAEDLGQERATGKYTVVLPDLNAWKNYVNELQEAKLRALGVSFVSDEPEPAPSISSQPSRQPSAQYPPLPFSPPLPTSSASSNHAIAAFPFPAQFLPGGLSAAQSPALPNGASPVPFASVPGKFNTRSSISFPATHSPFQHPPHGWPGQPGGLQGLNLHDSPSLMNMGGVLSPQLPYGLEGYQQTGSPAFNMHQRHQSLQYLPQQLARASPRLQDVREDEEEEEHIGKSPSKTPEPTMPNGDSLQAEIDDAEYHLEEQLRHELEHEDYNPHAQVDPIHEAHFVPPHMRQTSNSFPPVEHFANEPSKPLVLHHPRPHSRGHSLSQGFFRDQVPDGMDHGAHQQYAPLNNIPETQHVDDALEIVTNPSNLGTPIQNPDFSAFHQKTLSTLSNPWQDAVSAGGSARHSSHGSKPSFSKLNVDAPEFKFNPTSTFTPGRFDFSNNNSFQPAVLHAAAAAPNDFPGATPFNPIPPSGPSKISANAPVFAPGQGEFNFSSSGPKFRPDAPAFTPITQAVSSSPVGSSSKGASRRTDSIFGDIQIDTSELSKPTKAVSIPRPSSAQAARTVASEEDEELNDGAIKESKAKRAKSAAPEGDDVPLFAERPETEALESVEEDTVKDTRSDVEGPSAEDHAQPADTSFSSAVTSEQLDTQITTAAPSETSPAERTTQKWNSFEFDSPANTESLNEKRPAEDSFKSSLSVVTPLFVHGISSQSDTAEPAEKEPAEPLAASTPELTETPASARPKLTPKGLGSSRFASPSAKPQGLSSSRFAKSSSPVIAEEEEILESVEQEEEEEQAEEQEEEEQEEEEEEEEEEEGAEEREVESDHVPRVKVDDEPTFEEIDAVMQHLENDPSMGINKSAEAFKWPHPAVEATDTLSEDLQPPSDFVRAGRSLTPRDYHNIASAAKPLRSTELEDPFLDPPINLRVVRRPNGFEEAELDSEVASDWEGAFSEDEHSKLQNRAQFFDARVNEVVGGLLASRLEPLEKTLFSIHHSLATKSQRAPSSRRDVRSASTEYQESDADDEDDEPPLRRSMSPKRDRRLDQIRLVVTEALAAQQRNNQPAQMTSTTESAAEESAVLRTLVAIKEQLVAKSVAQEQTSKALEQSSFISGDDELAAKAVEFQAKATDLEQRLQFEQARMEKEITERRAAEDAAAELHRKLQAAETRVEAEIINRSVFDQRVADLEHRLRHQEDQTEEEVKTRRAAEDRLSEVQRLLRISSEEETRLREVVEERDHRLKTLEQSSGMTAMKMATLEAARTNWTQTQSEMTNRVNVLEADLRTVRQDNNHWRAEAERADEAARRHGGELGHTINENKRLQKSLDNVVSQLEENERLRESWRAKFLTLQDDMGNAAREVAEENARHIKRDQALLARQEVLEARLQAEAKTRERLEVEMERLQENERAGMRAINECKRLEDILIELRTQNAKLQHNSSRYQREFEEARESGVSEVKRTRMALQTEVDAANNQVNVVREELEEQNSKLRTELDSLKLGVDTAKAQNEMLLEDAHNSKLTELEELKRKHRNELEDMQTRYERQISNAIEDGQRTEQHLLERLSLSTSKTEHLQDRILHLEDKLEITKQAAAAAAQAAKSAGVESGAVTIAKAIPVLPEKISPQALRESIMVLQEQLQAREQRIEELEQTVADLDPDAASKISKRDDEISWLRELLAVRHSDLQDVILALSEESFDRVSVKDAAIRLKANLQMEEQERERAMHGGSAISLPNIAQTIQAATPRVAQAVGPIAAAWGNWRKGSTSSFRGLTGVLSAPAVGSSATPSKSRNNSVQQPSVLSGLLTPPASGLRQNSNVDNRPQPTAFSSTGRRYTNQSTIENRIRRESNSSRRSDKMSASETPLRRPDLMEEPMTPPMMHQSVYDSDAQPGDFDDHDFFEED
ncbi:hypothetical protein PT974_09295 [Cladobotryum mycophilum]|uniref:Myosin class II heavy chain n=1 Tax=Cladobotryum mycophilum TaxID=491253 RepID=A0ABR0SFS4_9HYPO